MVSLLASDQQSLDAIDPYIDRRGNAQIALRFGCPYGFTVTMTIEEADRLVRDLPGKIAEGQALLAAQPGSPEAA